MGWSLDIRRVSIISELEGKSYMSKLCIGIVADYLWLKRRQVAGNWAPEADCVSSFWNYASSKTTCTKL